jgi:hypothetical protein
MNRTENLFLFWKTRIIEETPPTATKRENEGEKKEK